jgi:hypothetical protein
MLKVGERLGKGQAQAAPCFLLNSVQSRRATFRPFRRAQLCGIVKSACAPLQVDTLT